MKGRIVIAILGFVLFISLPTPIFAENSVIINEFSIEPAQTIELYNISSSSADISNWYLDDNGGTTYFTIPANTTIAPNACILFTSSFNLNVSSTDTVRLFDSSATPTASNAKLVDSYSYPKSYGNNTSFFRNPNGESTWATGSASLGYINGTTQSCISSPAPTTAPTETITPSPNTTITMTPNPTTTVQPTTTAQISYDNMYLSEVLVNPPSGDKEWVELYNGNDFAVQLQNWFIDDIENGGASPKTFSLSVPANGYAVLELSTGIFNNDGDSVRLLDFNRSIKDDFDYASSEDGKSWGRSAITDEGVCMQEPTKGTANSGCIGVTNTATTTSNTSSQKAPTGTKTPTPTRTPTPTKTKTSTTKSTDTTISNSDSNTSHITKVTNEEFEGPTILDKPMAQAQNFLDNSTPMAVTKKKFPPLLNSLLLTSIALATLSVFSFFFKIKREQ
jgi:hypothetical protein